MSATKLVLIDCKGLILTRYIGKRSADEVIVHPPCTPEALKEVIEIFRTGGSKAVMDPTEPEAA